MAREVDLGLVVGAQGPKGDQGEPGKDGTGVNIKGSVGTETELPGEGIAGDAYLDNTGTLWVYVGSGGDSTNGKFKNAGNIKGPKGDTGATGPQGPKGDTGATGPQPSLSDSLNSTSTTQALTAAQGKVLNDKITSLLSGSDAAMTEQ